MNIIKRTQDAGLDIGQVITAPFNPDPTKWLECNGQTVLRASYPKLAVGAPAYTKYDAWKTEAYLSGWPASFSFRFGAIDPDTGIIVAVARANNAVYRSTDLGISWTAIPMSFTFPTTGAQICFGNDLFVLMPGSPAGTVCYTSPDGITWTPQTMPSSATWTYVAWNGSIFVATTSTSGTVVASSPDGITWTSRTLATSATANDLVVIGTTFVLCFGTGAIINTSVDGINWLAVTPEVGATIKRAVGGATWGLVGPLDGSSVIYRTTDCITWTKIPCQGAAFTPGGIIRGTDGILISGTGILIYTTDSGLTWLNNTVSQFSPISTNGAVTFIWDGLIYTIFLQFRCIEQPFDALKMAMPYLTISKWSRSFIRAA